VAGDAGYHLEADGLILRFGLRRPDLGQRALAPAAILALASALYFRLAFVGVTWLEAERPTGAG